MRSRASVLAGAASALLLSACGALDEGPREDTTFVQGALNLSFAQHQTACQADPRVQSGVVSLTECIGADIFFLENFNGNGRTCGSCHRVERNFTIDAPFIARLPASDGVAPVPSVMNTGIFRMRSHGYVDSSTNGPDMGAIAFQ